jgi:XRE family transcriptional regulator, regulator of sulfur utilization
MRMRKASDEILPRLATNLKRMREARGYTQHQLSHLCGFPNTYIGEIEQETVNITLPNLEALATGLRCLDIDLLMPIRPTAPLAIGSDCSECDLLVHIRQTTPVER